MNKSELGRLNCNVSIKLLEAIDKYADSLNINRTSAVSILITKALEKENQKQ